MCEDDFQRIMDELDEDDGDDFFSELTEDELELAANIEAQLKMEMAARAISEQTFLGPGAALPLCTPETDPAEELASAGVVRLGGMLSDSTAAELRDFVLDELERGISDAARQDALAAAAAATLGVTMDLPTNSAFSKVQCPEGTCSASQDGLKPASSARWDLRLPLSPIVRAALAELFGAASVLGTTLRAAAGGEDAEMWELAALISSPGAVAQVVHADTVWKAHPILFTAFVALQPISRELGPTRFVPFTHTDGVAHEAHEAAGDVRGLLSVTEGPQRWRQTHGEGGEDGAAIVAAEEVAPRSVLGLLQTGDVALYDGRTLHCATANTYSPGSGDAGVDEGAATDGMRILFYATFRHSARLDEEEARDDPACRSILPEYTRKYTLGTMLSESASLNV